MKKLDSGIKKSIKFNVMNGETALRRIVFLLALTFALCACSNAPAKPDYLPFPADVSVDFSPGLDGTPLPAPTKVVGEKWPPEVKAFIDGMIALFGERERTSLSTQEIESTLGVKLTAQSFVRSQVDAVYRISDSPLLNPISQNQLAEYVVGAKEKNAHRFHILKFPIDPKRFCVSPYDFAIYTGTQYAPELEVPLHVFRPLEHIYQPAYEWGMFKRASNGKYFGRPRPAIALTTSDSCIVIFQAITNTINKN